MILRGAVLAACALLLSACPADGPPAPAVAQSEAGTWSLQCESRWVVGWNDIDVTVGRADGAEMDEDLTLQADVTMPSMGHGSSEDVQVSDEGDGTWVVAAFFQMAGAWEVVGVVGDGTASEGFALAVEAVDE